MSVLTPNSPFGADPNAPIGFRYASGAPIYPIVGGARGMNAHGDIVTQTADGVDLNALWETYQAALEIYNAQRSALVRLFTFKVTDPYEDVYLPGAGLAEFEEATEYGIPTSYRPATASSAVGYRFKWYDLAARFTWQFLLDATASQADQYTNMAMEAENRLVYQEVMRTLFSNTRGVNKETNVVYPFYSGVTGDQPSPYGVTTFADAHNHFVTSGNATVDFADLDQLIKLVTEHGYSPDKGYNLIVMVNEAQGNVIRTFRSQMNGGPTGALWDFIPANNTPQFLIPLDRQIPPGAQASVPNQYSGFTVIGAYNNVLIVQEEHIPVGYMVALATGGDQALSNPIGVREHPKATAQGLQLVKGRTPDYPLMDAYFVRGFGTGVRHRGAGAVMQISTNATYTPPTSIAN